MAWVGSKGGFWGVDIFFVCYKSMRVGGVGDDDDDESTLQWQLYQVTA